MKKLLEISMTEREFSRYEVIKRAHEKRLRISDAAEILKLSSRQVLRISRRIKQEGRQGVVSKKRGAQGNPKISNSLKKRVLRLIGKKYSDFGPTLAHEYLIEKERLKISVSTVRNLMIANGCWKPKRKKRARLHPLRMRRARMGELVQIDGSDHDWFEGRAPKCTLLVYTDDATSALMHLQFVPSESTQSYFEATRAYLEKHGRPLSFYSDKHSVFRVNRKDALSGDGATQFNRAMEALDIKQICANSPQAKGRVERRNRDLQDRLIKAMRLKKLSNIQEANAYLPEFIADFNKRFAKPPLNPSNAHRPLLKEHSLDTIFVHRESRRLSKNLTLQYKNVIYQVITDRPEYVLKKASVTVLEDKNGKVTIEYHGKLLKFVTSEQGFKTPPEMSAKEVSLQELTRPKRHCIPPTHPWKRWRGFPSQRQRKLRA